MGIVIAAFIITAAYVGFHASQEVPEKEVDAHGITLTPLAEQQNAELYLKVNIDHKVIL